MKHYCKCRVNELTGEIDHIAVSDFPLTDDMVASSEVTEPQIETIPPTILPTFRIESLEFESEDDTFIRGGEVRAKMKMKGANLAARQNPTSKPELNNGMDISNFKNMVNK